MKEKPFLSSTQILEEYSKGRRDFSNITTAELDLSNKNLEGIIFRNSVLTGATFRGSNLTGADFSNSEMKWVELTYTNLKNAKFNKADLSWSDISDVIAENTSFKKANLSQTNFFNVNRSACIFIDANLHKVAWSITDITLQDLIEAVEEARRMGFPEAWLSVVLKDLEKLEKHWRKTQNLPEQNLIATQEPKPEKKEHSDYNQSDSVYSGQKDSAYLGLTGMYNSSIQKRLNKLKDIL